MKITISLGESQDNLNPLPHPLKKKDLNAHLNKQRVSKYLHYTNRDLYGISMLDCYPSVSDRINANLVEVIGRLKRKAKQNLSLRVCLNSHLAPQFIQQTKELGFLPSGIDVKANRLFLILSEIDKDSMDNATLFSREAKVLREDILRRRWADE